MLLHSTIRPSTPDLILIIKKDGKECKSLKTIRAFSNTANRLRFMRR